MVPARRTRPTPAGSEPRRRRFPGCPGWPGTGQLRSVIILIVRTVTATLEAPIPLATLADHLEAGFPLGTDPLSGSCVSKSDLSASALFAGLPEATLEDCALRARMIEFPRGALLAREGDSADSFYLLISGSVEVVLERSGENGELIDILGPGDCVGDLALLLQKKRTATIRSLRDCRAARISAEDFAWLLRSAPEFTLRLARKIGARLQSTTHRRSHRRQIESIAALPVSPNVSLAAFCAELDDALAAETSGGEGSPPLCRQVGLGATDRCDQEMVQVLQDADSILFIANASDQPEGSRLGRLLDLALDLRPRPQINLVLLHSTDPPYRGTLPWIRDRRMPAWHHLRPGRKADAGRLARRIIGRAIGMVLSGGGARGFAHIGVLRAFQEAGIPIDFIAGTSMGAVVGAQHAMGFDIETMLHHMRRCYLRWNGLPDYAIPWVAIRSGTVTNRNLRSMFGDTRIENLPTPYFCVSSNLSTAESVVHETGKIWHAARSSCSVPGLLPPVRSRGNLLVDGGLLDNLPVPAMRARCEGYIVASDVSVAVDFQTPPASPRGRRLFSALRRPTREPGIGQILMRTVQLASVRDSRAAGTPADLYLRSQVSDVGMNDFHRLDEIVERGAEYTRQQLAGWTR